MNSADFIAHCLELLAPMGTARARRMFGGHGLYVDDVFIAISPQHRALTQGLPAMPVNSPRLWQLYPDAVAQDAASSGHPGHAVLPTS